MMADMYTSLAVNVMTVPNSNLSSKAVSDNGLMGGGKKHHCPTYDLTFSTNELHAGRLSTNEPSAMKNQWDLSLLTLDANEGTMSMRKNYIIVV